MISTIILVALRNHRGWWINAVEVALVGRLYPASASSNLTPREQTRLANILGRLGSPFESERAAAGLLATAFIEKHGLTWSDLAIVPPVAPSRPNAPAKPPTDRRHGFSRFWQGYCRRRAAPATPTLSRFA